MDHTTRRDLAVRAAVEQELVTGDAQPLAALLDTATLRAAARSLHTAFTEVAAAQQPVLHT